MRRAGKVDFAQAAIVDALRARGHLVLSLAPVGNGCPDVLVGCRRLVTRFVDGVPRQAHEHVLVALEIKSVRNKRGDLERLTPREEEFHRKWAQWPVYVVSSIPGAIRVVENAALAAALPPPLRLGAKDGAPSPNVVSARTMPDMAVE